jgi:hypothetical protein
LSGAYFGLAYERDSDVDFSNHRPFYPFSRWDNFVCRRNSCDLLSLSLHSSGCLHNIDSSDDGVFWKTSYSARTLETGQ